MTDTATQTGAPTPAFLADVPRFLLFTGKGGVGKTSLACATAVHLADSGTSVLLVSTDPASNVSQVLGVGVGHVVTRVPGVPGLSALEIDPQAAAEQYRERIVGPVRGLLPEREIASITEQLSGSCTTEVAAFNEFTDLLADPDPSYDHIVFDTAPTGHTIRLLQLPGSWTGFLDAGKGDASCLGPLAGLDKQRASYAAAVRALTEPASTRLILVTRPQAAAIAEVDRTRSELAAIGIHATNLVVNGVMPDTGTAGDPLASAVREREATALAAIPATLAELPRDSIRLRPVDMVGLAALRSLLDDDPSTGSLQSPDEAGADAGFDEAGLGDLVDAIEADGHGVVLCMGKGGVGKTTIAAAIAVALAHRGHQVHLATTDPAAHLDQTLHGHVDRLTVSRIDPALATREYRDRIMATRGKNLDDAGRAALAEDLLSPCTEEVAVFGQFSRLVLGARDRYVVIDTAPTGHTLLLLDAAGSYHRDVVRQMGAVRTGYRTPLSVLQDPDAAKILIVTLPEPTPVQEALTLQTDLDRAGITAWAWIVNQSLSAAHPTSPLLQARAATEAEHVATVHKSAERVAVVPLQVQEPVGEALLAALTDTR